MRPVMSGRMHGRFNIHTFMIAGWPRSYRKYILQITQLSQYRYAKLQHRFAVTSGSPSMSCPHLTWTKYNLEVLSLQQQQTKKVIFLVFNNTQKLNLRKHNSICMNEPFKSGPANRQELTLPLLVSVSIYNWVPNYVYIILYVQEVVTHFI